MLRSRLLPFTDCIAAVTIVIHSGRLYFVVTQIADTAGVSLHVEFMNVHVCHIAWVENREWNPYVVIVSGCVLLCCIYIVD